MKTVFDFDRNMTAPSAPPAALRWRSAKAPEFGCFGSAALSEEGFCRLTAAERDYIRPVNDGEAWFGEHSSGIQIRFQTDSRDLRVRVRLKSKFDMTNMTQIGQCGLDLYVYDEGMGEFVLHEVARYDFDATAYEVPLSHFSNLPKKSRKYILNLPLYMHVEELEIGLEEDAAVCPFGFSNGIRLGVYGTSIVHGCAASRPGLSPVNRLSRIFDCETFNFGFSGVAFLEREMGEILGGRGLDVLLVDPEPNAGVDRRMKDNLCPFLDAFFERSPACRVVLFSRVPFALDLYDAERVRLADYYRGFLRNTARKYRKNGYTVAFSDGYKAFPGNFSEYTTDGIHPDDVGMQSLTLLYAKETERILQKGRGTV